MARIRTIKPEVAHSATLGRVSREARLCFVLLWTVADDAGRLRGDEKLLASLLYPYDTADSPGGDAKGLIGAWLRELVREGHIVRYVVRGEVYIAIPRWSDHQRIDKPSRSRLPGQDDPDATEFAEASESPREASGAGRDRDALERKGKEGRGGEPARSLSSEPPAGPRQRGGLIRSAGQQARLLQRYAFAGERVMVPHEKHDELRRTLGGADTDQRLRAWYATLDERVSLSGERINDPNEWKWLQAEFNAWCAPVTTSDGYRPASEFIAEQDRIIAQIAEEKAAAMANGTYLSPAEILRQSRERARVARD